MVKKGSCVDARFPARVLVPRVYSRAGADVAAPPEEADQNAQLVQPIATAGLLRSAEEMIAEVRRRAHDPSVFDDARTPFPWGAEISSDRIDAYFTFMDESTLRNFAADAEAGVSFQNSHVTRQLGFGRSIGGRYVDEETAKRTIAEFYTVPGVRLNEVSTDDFIIGVRSSLIADVSVGFHGGTWRCTICARDLWDWDCEHVPGWKYEVASDDKVIREILALARIEGAHLSEVSAVYDGATPGAAVLKSQEEARRGRIRPEVARFVETRYRCRLPDQVMNVPVPEIPQKEDRMSESPPQPEQTAAATQEQVSVDSGELAVLRAQITDQTRAADAQRARADVFTRALTEAGIDVATEELADRLRTLVAEAAAGRQYRADLLDEAIKARVQAFGRSAEEERYRALLERLPLEDVRGFRDEWRSIASGRLPVGRRSEDGGDPLPAPAEKNPRAYT